MTAEFFYYFELEISWIAVNLAQGSEETVRSILFEQFEQVETLSEPVFSFLKRNLQSKDPAKQHMGLWFAANLEGDSNELTKLIVNNLGADIFGIFFSIMDSKTIKKELITPILWNLQNFGRFGVIPKTPQAM